MMAASFNAAEGEGAYSANKGGIELSSLPVIHINTKKSKCKKCKKSINNFEERKQYQKEKLKLMCSSRSSSPTVSGGHSANENGGVDVSWNQTKSSSANSIRTASASANDKLVQQMQAQNTHNKYKRLEGKSISNPSNNVTTSQENDNTSLSAPTSAPALHAPTQKNNSVPSPSTQHSKRESSKTAELKRRLDMFTQIQRQHYKKRGLDGTTAAAAENKKRKMVHPIISGRGGTFNTNCAISQSKNKGQEKNNAIIYIDIDKGAKRNERPSSGVVKENTCYSNGDMKDNTSIRKEGSVCSTPGDFSKPTQVYSSDLSKPTQSLDDGRSKRVKSSEREKLKSPPEQPAPAPPPINNATSQVNSRSLSEVKVSSTASQSTAINSVNNEAVARQKKRGLSGSKLSPKQSTISSPSWGIPSEVHVVIQHPIPPHIVNSTKAEKNDRGNLSEAQAPRGQPKSPPLSSVSGGMSKTERVSTPAQSRTPRGQSSSHEGNDLPELLSESQSKPPASTIVNVDGNRIAGAPLKQPCDNVPKTDQGERAGPERPLKTSQKHLPKYPIGCPIWFNMSYSKPCSKYLNAEIGVVKAMSYDYDRNIHYKVERKCMGTSGFVRHETVTVSENELAFGYHCPVYVRMDDGPELSGKVTDIKPIIGDDGGIEQTTYSVLFTQDFRVRKEDGIAAERLRYQLSLQSLQLALKGKASSSKIQRMVAIRSNDRGEPVRNQDPPFIHEEVFGPTEDDSSLEAGSCSDDEDSGCTETKVEAPLKPRQECNHRTTGVRPTKSHNGYEVRVCFRSKQYCVGTYRFKADAALAYDLSSEFLGRPNFESNFPGKEDFKNALKNEANGKSVNISESYARVKKKVKELLAKHLPATNYAVSQKLKCNNTRKANENDELASDSESFNAETVNSSEDSSDDEDTCCTETDEETQAKCIQHSSTNQCNSVASKPITKCKYKGVKSAHGSYEARVKFGHKIYCFGTYKFMADAALAYDEGSTSMRNSNSRANFPYRDEYEKSIMSEANASGKSVEADKCHEAVLKKVHGFLAKYNSEATSEASQDDTNQLVNSHEKLKEQATCDDPSNTEDSLWSACSIESAIRSE